MSKNILLPILTTLISFILVNATAQAATNRSLGPFDTKILSKEAKDSLGNKHFGAGYRFFYDISYQTDETNNVPYAVYIGTANKVDVTAFEKHTLLQLDAHFVLNEAHPTQLGEFKRKIVLFKKVYWPDPKKEHIRYSENTVNAIWSSQDSENNELYKVYKEYSKRINLPIGPIPFVIAVGYKGTAGIVGHLETRTPENINVDFKLGPEADLSAITEAGVNIIVARGNATSNLKLIGIGQYVESNIELAPILRHSAAFKFELPGKFESMSGSVKLKGEVRKIKKCSKKIFGKKIKYPCGLRWEKVADKTLASWKGFVRNYSLFSYEKKFYYSE